MRSLLSALVGDAECEALFSDEAELRAMLQAEAALARAEAETGFIPRESAAAIVAACEAFRPDWDDLRQGAAKDGVVVPALVRQLRDAVGDRFAATVHKGATSQDIVDTGLVLRLAEVVRVIRRRLDALAAALLKLEADEGAKPLLAHTRMQVALPITAADKISTWRSSTAGLLPRLAEVEQRLLVLQLGGPVGTRAEFGDKGAAISHAMAADLGLGLAQPWHSDRQRIADFAAWLSLLTGSLGKLGQDVVLMAQNEISAVKLAVGGTSSAMAHKQNPVSAEVLVALGRYNAGLLGTLHQALIHENERSGAAWTLEWLTLPSMVIAAGASLRLALALTEGLRFMPDDANA